MAVYTDWNPVFNTTEGIDCKLKDAEVEVIQRKYTEGKGQYKWVAWLSCGAASDDLTHMCD